MLAAESITLHTICNVERTQLLTILTMSVKNPQLAGFLLTQNRYKFLYVEVSTAWLHDCPYHISPLNIAKQCYHIIPVNLLRTVVYVNKGCRCLFSKKMKSLGIVLSLQKIPTLHVNTLTD